MALRPNLFVTVYTNTLYSRYLDLFGFIKITSGESELLPKNEKFASWIVEVILGINLLSL